MKLHNDLIIFDLETTADSNNYITEIGAVCLRKDSLLIGPSFELLIKPPIPLDEKSKLITGITDEDLKDSLDFNQSIKLFEEWCNGLSDNIKNLRLCAWGNYFDVNVLRQEYDRMETNFPFSGTCLDAKSWAFLWASLAGHRTDKLSVKRVSEEYMGLEPVKYHRALNDARQTGKIVQRIFSDLSSGVFLPLEKGQKPVHIKVEKNK